MKDANGLDLSVGLVVQIDPKHDPCFGGCFMLVTELKSFGAVGFVLVPGKDGEGGRAYYRCPSEGMVVVGKTEWIPGDET